MDKRLSRGLACLAIGAGLLYFGKGILDPPGNKLMENAMIIGLVLGLYLVVLGLSSIYDFVAKPPEHEY